MRIDQTGQNDLLGETVVDAVGVFFEPRAHGVEGSRLHDVPSPNRNGSRGGVGRIHGEDPACGKYRDFAHCESAVISAPALITQPDPNQVALAFGLRPILESGASVTKPAVVDDLDLTAFELEPFAEIVDLSRLT